MMLTKQERYQKAATHFSKGVGHVTIAECDVCGYLDWQSTDLKKPASYTVITQLLGSCPICTEVLKYSPHVMNWVLSVVNKMREDIVAECAPKQNADDDVVVDPEEKVDVRKP
jgi:hypothetical protein